MNTIDHKKYEYTTKRGVLYKIKKYMSYCIEIIYLLPLGFNKVNVRYY